jgi:hypothetical protein
MLIQGTENALSKMLFIGPATVTLLVFTQGVTDPVNATKFFALGGLAFALFVCIPLNAYGRLWNAHKIILALLAILFAASLNSLTQSKAPISQSLYGVYGRNNGFLLYFFLILCFVSVLTISKQKSFHNVVKSLIAAGIVNLIYCLWVIAFGDFLSWSNPYGNILGTLGNPNFIGAFLGMLSSVLITAIIFYNGQPKIQVLSFLLLVVALFEIYKSHAIQGRVLFVAGIGINLIMYFWSKRDKLGLTLLSAGTFLILGILGIFGTLQKGPLAELLYKDSVSLRGQYWYAGVQMGWNNLLTGVGFDSYGDWYRFFRRPSALVRPGIETVSNTAHNVYIDLFAFGGAPLLLSYTILNIAVLVSIIRVLLRRRSFDFVFVSLSGAWICFQLQSIISINQIGLAVWGWILGASIIAFDRSTSKPDSVAVNRRQSSNVEEIFGPGLRAGLGLLLGLLIAAPPLAADMKWRSAQVSRDAKVLEAVLVPSYLNPSNTFRNVNVVGAFVDSNLEELALINAAQAIKFNPNSYDSWRIITYIKTTSDQDKQEALLNMKRLDPLNPNLIVRPK